jgi:hypothetical protein
MNERHANDRRRIGVTAAAMAIIVGACSGDSEDTTATSVAATDPAATYSTQAFIVPFDVAAPEWLPGVEPGIDSRNFVTWEPASGSEPAVRVLAPVSVFLTGDDNAVEPPEDFLAHVLSLEAERATIEDRADVDVDGHPGTLMTLSTDEPLDGVLGCPINGLDAGDCYGIQPDFALRLAVVDVDGTTIVAWLRHRGSPDTDVAAAEFAAFEEMLAALHFADREPTAEPDKPAPASPLEGEWTMTSTLEELENSPLLQDPDEVNDENWGEWTFTFEAGRFTFSQENAIASNSASGDFQVDGDRLQLDLDNVEHFEMRWRIDGDQLTFTPDDSIGFAPTPFFLHSWTLAS